MKLGERLQLIKAAITPYAWTNEALINKTLSDRGFLLNPSTRIGNNFGNQAWFFGNNGSEHLFTWKDNNSSLNAYNRCPPVSAIINRKAQAHINGKTWVLNTKGNVAESVPAKKINNLFANPNKMQSGKQFKAQAYTYMQLYGYAIILLDKPFGVEAIDANSMWIIPNWLIEIEENDTLFFKEKNNIIKSIKMTYKGKITNLVLENIFIIKDFNISDNSVFLPSSRLKSNVMPVNNIIGSFESRNTIINKRGPNYVVSNKAKDQIGTQPMTPDERMETEKAFGRFGLRAGQSTAIITSASIDITNIGFDVGQMKLHEEVIESTGELCNAFSFPKFLLGLTDATFNNQREAEIGLYQNAIIPETESEDEQWSSLFKLSDYNLRIETDFSHVTALQQDAENKAKARKAMNDAMLIEWRNGMITLNMWLEKNGEDKMTDVRGDMFFPEYVAAYGDPQKMITPQSKVNENMSSFSP